MISYRLAKETDLECIMSLIADAIEVMESQGIHQWDEIYPAKEDFMEDEKNKSLYVGVDNESGKEKIAVVFALNQNTDPAYGDGNWTYPDRDYFVIHRLCVNPEFQSKGIAKMTMKHIEDILRQRNINSIRLDVFSQNPFALKLYDSFGYGRVGEADWRKGKFYLMEKYF